MYDSSKPANGTSLVSADIRENFRALKEDDIVEGVAALGIVEGMLAASAVTQAKLKTSSGSVSQVDVGSSLLTLPGGEYGFYPRHAQADGLNRVTNGTAGLFHSGAGNRAAACYVYLSMAGTAGGAGQTITSYQRYVTSSGEVFWIFILRDKITKDIKAMYQAPDHPCFGNGGKPLVVQHPFGSYDPETQEIIVINPTEKEVTEMKGRCEKGEDEPDKDLLEIITEEYDIDENSSPKWPTKEVTVGLPKDRDWKRDPDDTKVTPIKKVIPQPKGVLVKKLRRK